MGYQQAAIAWLFLVQVSADDAHSGIAAAGVEVQASDVVIARGRILLLQGKG